MRASFVIEIVRLHTEQIPALGDGSLGMGDVG